VNRDRDWPMRVEIDPTAFVAPGAVIVGEVGIAGRSSVWFHAVLRGDSAPITVGEETNVQDHTVVHVDEGQPASIGSRVTIGHRAIVHGCVIEDECLIGMGAIILSGARIGAGSLLGAASLGLEGQVIPPGSLVLGAPARVVGAVSGAHREAIRRGASHYVELARGYRERGIVRDPE
jgi:carbonic anhydrase/acetyltransferase-like protein (isoleucine patch superfamily)